MRGAPKYRPSERPVCSTLEPIERWKPVPNKPDVLGQNHRLAVAPCRGHCQGTARIETLQDVKCGGPPREAIQLAIALEPPDRYRHPTQSLYNVETWDADPRALTQWEGGRNAARGPADVQAAC